jgi:hypothetical protein
MRYVVDKLLDYRVRDLLDVLWRKPQMIPAVLRAPRMRERVALLAAVADGLDEATAHATIEHYFLDMTHYATLNAKLVGKRFRRPRSDLLQGFWYALVRHVRPQVVVETGVFDGEGSACILQALEDNGEGLLISIDLPAREPIEESTARCPETTLPPGCDPGWAIPDGLRARHQLRLGDARQLLPEVLREHPRIDIFIHDSLHTYDHMTFEYTCAWQALRPGGYLCTDDVWTNTAFVDFCKRQGVPMEWSAATGVARKP